MYDEPRKISKQKLVKCKTSPVTARACVPSIVIPAQRKDGNTKHGPNSRSALWPSDQSLDDVYARLVHAQEYRRVPGDRKVRRKHRELQDG